VRTGISRVFVNGAGATTLQDLLVSLLDRFPKLMLGTPGLTAGAGIETLTKER
jgi:hypothetical protein